jgi:hypothetical protein
VLSVHSVLWTFKYLDFVDPDLENYILKIEHTVQTHILPMLVTLSLIQIEICKFSKKNLF